MSAGTVFTELDLDFSKFEKNQQKLLQSATSVSLSVEKNWQNLGAKSDQIYEAMRKSAENSLDMIKAKSLSTGNEIQRAQEAYNAKISQINKQQFGEHESLLDKLKTNWIAASAAIYAAWALVGKAWNIAETAASYNEQMTLLDALARKYDTTATAIVDKVREIGDGMISMASAAEVSAGALAKGLNPDMLNGLAKAAVVLKDVMGTTADDAFRRLTEAMETNREKSLKLAVGVIDLKDRYGEAAAKMSETEKQAALYGMVMEKVADIEAQTAGSTKSVADQMETFKVTLKGLELTLGQGIIRAGAGAIAIFDGLAAAALTVASGVALAVSGFALATGNMSLYNSAMANYNAAQGAAAELTKKSTENFALMTASTADLTTATAAQTVATTASGLSIGAQEAAAKAAALAQKEQEVVIKETSTAMDALLKVMQAYGAEQIKIAGAAFATALKAENVSVVEMTAALTTYTAALKTVYDARIAGEQAVAQAMKDSGASMDPKVQLEAQAALLKTQKEYLVASLAGWQTYYDALASQHAKATELMKTKEKELATLQAQGRADYNSYLNMSLGLQEKLLIAQGAAQNGEQVYNLQRNALQAQYDAAMALSGEAKVTALQAYMTKAAAMTGQVTSGNATIYTSEEMIKKAMENVDKAQDEIAKTQRDLIQAKKDEIEAVGKWKGDLETAMGTAKQMMIDYTKQITELSRIMLAMDKEIAMTVSDKATGPLMAIKSLLDSIQSKEITVTTNQVINQTVTQTVTPAAGGGGGGISGLVPPPVTTPDTSGGAATWEDGSGLDFWGNGGAFQGGNIIPFSAGAIFDTPTFFPMARGMGLMGEAGPEAVMPLTRTSDGKLGVKASGGGQPINLTVNISGVNKSSEQLVREIARPLKDELRRLSAVGG